MQKTQATVTQGSSPLRRYQDVVVGNRSWLTLVYYEACTLFGVLPGLPGLILRRLFWPRLFGSCGRGTAFGSNVVIRHPGRIAIGDRVVVSDGCILDARTDGVDRAIVIGEDTILSNNVMISCKQGTVAIGSRVGLGTQTVIHSVNQCPVSIGSDVLIGPDCYIAGGGNYNIDRLDIPMSQQGLKEGSGVTIEDDVWLGAKVTVLPDVVIGTGSIAAAGAVVSKSVEPRTVCGGVPAKTLGVRGQT